MNNLRYLIELIDELDRVSSVAPADADTDSGNWVVMLYNDPRVEGFTVADILSGVFALSSDEAIRVMRAAHQSGIAIVKPYDSQKKAEAKALQANEAIRQADPVFSGTGRKLGAGDVFHAEEMP